LFFSKNLKEERLNTSFIKNFTNDFKRKHIVSPFLKYNILKKVSFLKNINHKKFIINNTKKNVFSNNKKFYVTYHSSDGSSFSFLDTFLIKYKDEYKNHKIVTFNHLTDPFSCHNSFRKCVFADFLLERSINNKKTYYGFVVKFVADNHIVCTRYPMSTTYIHTPFYPYATEEEDCLGSLNWLNLKHKNITTDIYDDKIVHFINNIPNRHDIDKEANRHRTDEAGLKLLDLKSIHNMYDFYTNIEVKNFCKSHNYNNIIINDYLFSCDCIGKYFKKNDTFIYSTCE
jgi:hypothetical protein